jgi:opacity protein-like surface antigen
MKRTFWILFAALLVMTTMDANGQRWKLRRYQLDMYVGVVSFHGDIGLADRPLANAFNGIRPAIGVMPRFLIRKNLAVSLDLAYLNYGGKDEAGSTHARLYSFNSQAFQHMARLEYYLVGASTSGGSSAAIYNRRGMVNNFNKLQLYVFGGVGGILSKAKVKDLNNNGEEPITNPGYDNSMQYTLGFPLGGGVKFALDPRWSVGAELGYQITLGDKLDGYQSDWSNYNDSYYLISIKAVMHIRNDKNSRPIFNKYYR